MKMRLTWANSMAKALLLSVLGLCLALSSVAGAQPPTHTVIKGDTLWGICEKYYGDAELWPKLWEMNPFITNPHLLKPGDVIKLLESKPEKPKKAEPAVKEPPKAAKTEDKAEPKMTGIHIRGITVPNAIGCLTLRQPEPWGYVFGTDSQKLILAKGDVLFLDFSDREGIRPGDPFLVARSSDLIQHPLNEKGLGYLLSARAKVLLKERAQKNIYRAEIVEQYQDAGIGDMVFPFSAGPSCLKPLPVDKELRGVLVAMKEGQGSAGRFSVVYLDSGSDKGLRPGHLLEILRIKNIPDPPAPQIDPETLLFEALKVKTIPELFERLSRESPLFELVVGHMIVLDVKPDTATALILSTKESIPKGALFRGIPTMELPEFISSLPSCAAQ